MWTSCRLTDIDVSLGVSVNRIGLLDCGPGGLLFNYSLWLVMSETT
jgi:hypothetical protein